MKSTDQDAATTIAEAISEAAKAIANQPHFDEKIAFGLDYLRGPLKKQAEAQQNIANAIFMLALTQATTKELKDEIIQARLAADKAYDAAGRLD